MGRTGRRGMGKSDPLDARRIAAAVLSLPVNHLRTPRQDEGVWAAARILLTARDGLAAERTRAVNALTALLRIIDPGIDARRPLGARTIAEVARWRTREEALSAATARTEAMRLAQRILEPDTELSQNMTRMSDLVAASPAAELLDRTISSSDAHRELVRRSARANGIGTVKDFANYFRLKLAPTLVAIGKLALTPVN